MADQSFQQLYARLNVRIRDTDDFTFSQAEKTEALNAAFDDPYAYTIKRDTSILVVALTPSYQLPSGFEDVGNVAVDYYGDGSDFPLDRSAWQVADGNIIFKRNYMLNLPVGKALILYGKYKLTPSDFVPSFLQEYVLCRAAQNTLELLRSGITNRFLRNDATMQELLASGAAWGNKAERLKGTLHNHLSVRG